MYLRRRRPSGGQGLRISESSRAVLDAAGAELPRRIGQLLDREAYVALRATASHRTVLLYSIRAQKHFIGVLDLSAGVLGNVFPVEGSWDAGSRARLQTSDLLLARERAEQGFASHIDRMVYLTPEMSAQFT